MTHTRLHPALQLGEDRLSALRNLLPEAFADGQIHWDTLREILGDNLEEGGEHFGLSWPGKREARRLATQPSHGALQPAPGEGVDEDTTRNLFIEGDNLEVLKLLVKAYARRVKMIYIDPPYNTGNDFVYNDDFSEPLEAYLRRTGQVGLRGELLTTNSKADGRYHSTWLSMMYPRLRLARSLLDSEGVIFVSIDDNEFHNLRLIMDELFGPEQFVGVLVWKSRHNVDSRNKSGLSADHEYVLAYGKRLRGREVDLEKYSNPDNDPRGPWMSDNLVGLATAEKRPNLHYDLVNPATGINYGCPSKGWRYSRATMEKKIAEGRILWPATPEGRPRHKKFLNELRSTFTGLSSLLDVPNTLAGTKQIRDLFGADIFDFPKPVELISALVEQVTTEEDVILDFFAGSCPTAHAVFESNKKDGSYRQFVMIQLPEPTQRGSQGEQAGFGTIAEIGKERIRRASARLKAERAGQLDLDERDTSEDLGFKVYKLERSNFARWNDYEGDDPQTVQSFFDAAITPLVEGWSETNLLSEVLLLEGFPLDSEVEVQSAFHQNKVRLVSSPFHSNRLWICLDETVTQQTVDSIGAHLSENDVFICLDSALTDEAKLRLSDAGTLKTI